MANDFDKVLAVLVGVYLFAVWEKGNTNKLVDLLKDEKRYLEFLVALAAIYTAVKYDKTGFIAPLVTLGALGIALRAGGFLNTENLSTRFAKGDIGLFDYIKNSFSKG